MFTWIILIVIVADLLSKKLAEKNLPIVKNQGLIGNLTVAPTTAVLITAAIFAVLFLYYLKSRSYLSRIQNLAFSFILGGAAGNLLERIFRGYVTDFIFIFNGVLNIADLAIFTGILMLILSLKSKKQVPSSTFGN